MPRREPLCLLTLLIVVSCTIESLWAQQDPRPTSEQEISEKISRNSTELDTWDPPEILKKSFPYYFAGYDYEDHPVWVFEFGKWDLKSYFENGGKDAEDLYGKYTDQSFYRASNSPWRRAKDPENPAEEWVCINDLDGYDLAQLSSLKAIQQNLVTVRGLTSKAGYNLAYAFIINANYLGLALVNIVRPIVGGILGKSDVLGTNKRIWLPKLLKKIPRESLPEWYGGFRNFTPIAVFG